MPYAQITQRSSTKLRRCTDRYVKTTASGMTSVGQASVGARTCVRGRQKGHVVGRSYALLREVTTRRQSPRTLYLPQARPPGGAQVELPRLHGRTGKPKHAITSTKSQVCSALAGGWRTAASDASVDSLPDAAEVCLLKPYIPTAGEGEGGGRREREKSRIQFCQRAHHSVTSPWYLLLATMSSQ
jgi:hypothetical protein